MKTKIKKVDFLKKSLSEQLLNKIKNLVSGEMAILDRDYIITWASSEGLYTENEFKKYKNIIYRGINFIDNRIIYLHKDEECVIVVEEDNEFNRDLMEMILLLVEEEKEYRNKEDVIKGLINGEIDKKYADSMLKKMNYRQKKSMQIIVVECARDIQDVFDVLKEFVNKEIILLVDKRVIIINTIFDEEISEGIKDVILSETMVESKVAKGTVVNQIVDLKSSYDKAMKALFIGKRVLVDKGIYDYEEMILPILIGEVKSKRLSSFNKTLFKGVTNIIEDRELMQTAESFLENSLNISETAKKMFIHRNTLTYRLNKIKKLTNYDLRNFEDAVNFKIAIYINNYIRN